MARFRTEYIRMSTRVSDASEDQDGFSSESFPLPPGAEVMEAKVMYFGNTPYAQVLWLENT